MHVSFQPQASIQDTFYPWQVAITRMDQQVWKQELDAAQKKEKGAETEKGGKRGKVRLRVRLRLKLEEKQRPRRRKTRIR